MKRYLDHIENMSADIQFVVESITDSASREYFKSNTASISAVQDYAENGCDIRLNDEEAKTVIAACIEVRNLFEEDTGLSFTERVG